MEQVGQKKGRVGAFECWLVGPMAWEVRRAGNVLARAGNMNECFRAAERLHNSRDVITAYYEDRAASGQSPLTAHR